MFSQVAEFHRAFGQLVSDTPTLPDQATRDLRIALIVEEFEEYLVAAEARDLVEVADALADMAYIACGTSVAYGIVPNSGDLFFSPATRAAMPPCIPNDPVRKHCTDSLRKRMVAYLGAEEENDIKLIDVNLHTLLSYVMMTATAYHIPIQTVFDEVHRSNMSKLGADGKPVYREDGKVLKGPTFFRPNIAAILTEAEARAWADV